MSELELADKLIELADKLEKIAATLVVVNEQVQQAAGGIRDEIEKIKYG